MGAGAQTGGDSGEQDRGQRADRGIVVLTGEHEPLVADGQGGVDLAGVVGGDEQGAQTRPAPGTERTIPAGSALSSSAPMRLSNPLISSVRVSASRASAAISAASASKSSSPPSAPHSRSVVAAASMTGTPGPDRLVADHHTAGKHTYRPWERGKDVVVQVICCLPGGNVFGRPLRVPAPGLIWWPWLWHLLCHNHSRTLCKRAVQKIG